jgi:hypothetical protein
MGKKVLLGAVTSCPAINEKTQRLYTCKQSLEIIMGKNTERIYCRHVTAQLLQFTCSERVRSF